MNQFVTAQSVRDYATLSGTTGRYSDANIGSNILAAQDFLQRESARLFELRSETMTFSTDNRSLLAIPDLRSASSVTLNGAVLTADAGYWLIPDVKHSGVYVAIQLAAFGGGGTWYLANSEWWDRGLDWPRAGSMTPNDLAITGSWGWDPLPPMLLLAVKALGAWYTKRPDALLANAVINADGTALDYSAMPPEVTDFLRVYRRGEQAVAV